MNNTPIRSARGLGGKLGKRVCSLLPTEIEDATLGCVAKLFSLHDLSNGLESEEAGQLVFNICRGIDYEPVKETFGALIKSITASKNFVSGTLKDIQKWISLLADDVLRRVDIDTNRNNRIPKRFTVQYLASTDHGKYENIDVTVSVLPEILVSSFIQLTY
jgi:DNA polymerase eta